MDTTKLNCSIVLLAEYHNPSLVNPDFLRLNEIVPESWSWNIQGEPFTTPPIASATYDSGVGITVEPNKLQVNVDGVHPHETKIVDIAKAYVHTLHHIRYTALGFNFRYYHPLDTVDSYLKDRFLKPGPWDSGELPLQSLGLTFVYQFDSKLTFSIEGATQAEYFQASPELSRVLLVKANFHRTVTEYPSVEEVTNYLDSFLSDWARFESCAQNIVAI